jgi:hypothetical protein
MSEHLPWIASTSASAALLSSGAHMGQRTNRRFYISSATESAGQPSGVCQLTAMSGCASSCDAPSKSRFLQQRTSGLAQAEL